MAFCHNCGVSHNEGDMFCQNCGVQLIAEAQAESVVTSAKDAIDNGDADVLRGVVMTNIARLSKRFSVSQNEVSSMLNSYIASMRQYGVDYTLFDTSDMGCGDSWIDHARELTKLHIAKFKGSNEPLFLFIVGGDDIIPMPVIDNVYYHARVAAGDTEYRDKDIDSDLPYAYLLGEHTQRLIYSGELFNYNPYFCVGRLPFDAKCDIEVLRSYFERAVAAHSVGGVNIESAYAQTFRNWCNESYITSGVMNIENILPAYSQKYAEEFTYNNLLTSPGVVVENIEPAFNTNASLLFFNMHGSDNPANPYFMGESVSFSPKQLASLNGANIVVTEACYGAKFKGLDASHSMLLTALSNKTLVYFGSSRIALGGGGYTYERVEDLMSADLYFKYLLDALTLGGFPVAYSVEYARVKFIEAVERLELKDMLTIAEFNLYGDPTLFSYMGRAKGRANTKATTEPMKLAPLAEGKGDCGFEIETLYESKGNSLLSMVRSAVDRSLQEIVDVVNRELYERHGLKPRDLSSIARVKYKSGGSRMEFVYSTKEGEIAKIYVVDVDKGVNRVLISK